MRACRYGIISIALLLAACDERFDGAFTPGSPNYVGDEWARDSNGDGISDSIAKYIPRCNQGPEKCLRNAKALAADWNKPHALSCRDMILWRGSEDAPFDLTFSPVELSYRGWVIASSDSSKVRPAGESILARSDGFAQITARILDDTPAVACMVRVVSTGKRVQSVSATNLAMIAGADSAPVLAWLPVDATYKEYSLASGNPAVAVIHQGVIHAVGAGRAEFVVTAQDGGAQDSFTVTVTLPDTGKQPINPLPPPPVNQPPRAVITAPIASSLFSGGAVIAFAGTGVDPEDGAVPASSCTWKAVLLRGGVIQSGPLLLGPLTGTMAGSFTMPRTGATSTDIACRIYLSVQDSKGLENVDSIDLVPATASLTLATNPPGLSVELDSVAEASPFSATAVPGFLHQIAVATPQRSGGKNYAFESWSDGNALRHTIAIPYTNASLTAAFSTLLDSVQAGDLSIALGDQDKNPSIAFFPPDAAQKDCKLISSDTSRVAIVNGLIHAVGLGAAKVAVIPSSGAKSDTFNVTVTGELPTPNSFTLTAKLRDFREIPDQSQNPIPAWAHPDFNNDLYLGCGGGEENHYVDSSIDVNGAVDSTVFKYDNRQPKLINLVGAVTGRACYTSFEKFDGWYNDKDTSVNRPFLMDMTFNKGVGGKYQFKGQPFFPLDSQKPGVWYNLPGKNWVPFGHLSTGGDSIHNFGFTMEFHSKFTYKAGKSQVFDFSGDDDVWVFINGKLAIDLAGIHPTLNASINLDSAAASFGLANGGTYMLDFFFAERHTNGSQCTISTNLQMTEK